MANYYKHTRSLSLEALSEAVVVLQCLDRLPAAVTSIDSTVGILSVCACLHTCMCVWACTVQACAFMYLLASSPYKSHWTRAQRELLVLAIVAKVVQWSNAYHSCLWNGSSFQCLSVSTASPRTCSCLLISFNKHQIPQQVFLCTCEADEVCLLACGRKTGIKKKISFVMTVNFWGAYFALCNSSPHMYLRGFVPSYQLLSYHS